MTLLANYIINYLCNPWILLVKSSIVYYRMLFPLSIFKTAFRFGLCGICGIRIHTSIGRGGARHFYLGGPLEGPVLQQGELSMVCVGLSERDLIWQKARQNFGGQWPLLVPPSSASVDRCRLSAGMARAVKRKLLVCGIVWNKLGDKWFCGGTVSVACSAYTSHFRNGSTWSVILENSSKNSSSSLHHLWFIDAECHLRFFLYKLK